MMAGKKAPGITSSARNKLSLSSSREKKPRQWLNLALLLPALILLGVFFAYPLVDMLMRSVSDDSGYTLEYYRRALGRPVYLRVLLNTFELALIVTITALVLAYPFAFAISRASGRKAGVLLGLVLIPFFTSILVRTYAWMVILGRDGMLNQALEAMGLGSVQLLYNRPGVVIGMVYALLPYMVLTLFSVMRGIDPNLMQAASTLGANDWQVFRRIFLPLSLPGIVGGCLLVFILSLGYFITPRLMGGDRDQTIATIIEYQVEFALNWNFAATLAAILLVVTLLGYAVYSRVAGLQALFESKDP
jgi:putative spermidine/putrescine transport system permease protein